MLHPFAHHALGGGYGGGPFQGDPGFHGAFMGGFSHSLSGFVFLAAVAITIWFFATGRHRSLALQQTGTARPFSSAPADLDPAEEVARERYARGAITAEEYATIITTLRGRA